MAHAAEVQRVRRSAEQWRSILAEWSSSDLSQAEFCRRRGFSLVTFGGWKRHFGGGTLAPGRSEHTPGANVRFAGTERPAFVEVATRSRAAGTGLETAAYEVRLANGRAVRVGPDFDPAALRRLLAIVDAHDDGAAEGRGC
jgi:hypothetical protein